MALAALLLPNDSSSPGASQMERLSAGELLWRQTDNNNKPRRD